MSLNKTGHKKTSKRVTHLWRSFWSAMAYTGTDWKRRQPMENTSGSRVFSSRPNHLHQLILLKVLSRPSRPGAFCNTAATQPWKS